VRSSWYCPRDPCRGTPQTCSRGFHGEPGLHFEPTSKAGRLCISAEDLLARALRREGFDVIAIFGTDNHPDSIALQEDARAEVRYLKEKFQLEKPSEPGTIEPPSEDRPE
ncbi:MAG: hypothetical protein AAF514_13095, partial [Verrucomicrobiota bacterium]